MTVEDWAEIRRLHRSEGMAIKAISRKLEISRNAVRRALASDSPPAYSRPPRGSVVDAVEPRIRELLQETPTMPATVIAERIEWRTGGDPACPAPKGTSAGGNHRSHCARWPG